MPQTGGSDGPHQEQTATEGFGMAYPLVQCIGECNGIGNGQRTTKINATKAKSTVLVGVALVAIHREAHFIDLEAKQRRTRTEPWTASVADERVERRLLVVLPVLPARKTARFKQLFLLLHDYIVAFRLTVAAV